MNNPLSVAVTTTELSLLTSAQKLAEKKLLPYVNYQSIEGFDFILVLTSAGLYLEALKGDLRTLTLKIDFLKGPLGYRLNHLNSQKQLLASAIGFKPKTKPIVLDATAGFGSDSFILAQLGCKVTLLERSPFIFLLLQDALVRALKHPKFQSLSINLIKIDALIYLKQISIDIKLAPEVIYLDPMYPHSTKSALVKKKMRFLRQLVGNDTDASNLLKLALSCATQRVVVKRPYISPYLSEIKPHHSIYGKQLRLDVYLTNFFKF